MHTCPRWSEGVILDVDEASGSGSTSNLSSLCLVGTERPGSQHQGQMGCLGSPLSTRSGPGSRNVLKQSTVLTPLCPGPCRQIRAAQAWPQPC